MSTYKHSVTLDIDKCKGCTNCLKRCPTEAIRIRDGHAVIDAERCIDCGECVRVCPYKAKKAFSDKLEQLRDFKWKVALPAPSLYGQFDNLDDIDYVLQGLLDYGFDDVYEVSRAAELVSGYTRRYLRREGIRRPVISSACPVVVRLISLRFPFLCDNVMPLLPPMEIAGMLAREQARERNPGLRDEDIGICFISPCPAKVSYVKNSFMGKKSNVDLVVSMNDVYFALLPLMKKDKTPMPISHSGMIGISWASAGGEASALFNDRYLAADGIENVIRVLDQIENGNMPSLEFIELNACSAGCVGGTMAVENPYIAKTRLQTLRRYLPVTQNWSYKEKNADTFVPEEYFSGDRLKYQPITLLDNDMDAAMRKMQAIEAINERLPHLDCGSCGSPTCHAFAEDIVNGEASENECIVKMRERIRRFLAKDEPAAKEREADDRK